MNTIKIVSLGSGAPDNITLRAFSVLKESDVIFAPDGEAVRTIERLALFYDLIPKVRTFSIPMQKNPEAAHQVYQNVTDSIDSLVQEGKRVAIVTIGDAGIYSSAYKIANSLAKLGLDVEILSGVPSFVAGMSRFRSPLVEQGQNLLVFSSISSSDDILHGLKNNCVVVVMKLSLYGEMIKDLLKEHPYPFVYFENIGAPNEYMTSKLTQLCDRQFPYFSLITIKPYLV